jgi:hypothetical protein
MSLADHLKGAIQSALDETLSDEVGEIVAKEVRRAFREHEDEFSSIIRISVAQAIAEMLKEERA